MFVTYNDPRVSETVRNLNRQRAEAIAAGHAAIRTGQTDAAVEHFYTAEQLGDLSVDACTLEDEDQSDGSDDCNYASAVRTPLGELDVMEAMVGLFADLNTGAKQRVLIWAQARFLG